MLDWHRLRPPVYRGSTFRCRLLELSVAVHLYGEIQATLRAIREISMNPNHPGLCEAAADACADQEHCQIGASCVSPTVTSDGSVNDGRIRTLTVLTFQLPQICKKISAAMKHCANWPVVYFMPPHASSTIRIDLEEPE